jgi:hypothetical protein
VSEECGHGEGAGAHLFCFLRNSQKRHALFQKNIFIADLSSNLQQNLQHHLQRTKTTFLEFDAKETISDRSKKILFVTFFFPQSMESSESTGLR